MKRIWIFSYSWRQRKHIRWGERLVKLCKVCQKTHRLSQSSPQRSIKYQGLFTNLGMVVFPRFMFFFQSFYRIHMMRSGGRHFESEPARIRNVHEQRLNAFNQWQNKMAASSLSLYCARSLFIFPYQKLRCFCTQGDSHTVHVPVMLKECLSFLTPRDGQVSRANCSLLFGYK